MVPAAAPCTHPPPRGVQTNLGKFLLVLESPLLIEILSLFGGGAGYLHPPSRQDTGVCVCGVRLNIRGIPTHDLDNE